MVIENMDLYQIVFIDNMMPDAYNGKFYFYLIFIIYLIYVNCIGLNIEWSRSNNKIT